MLHAALGEEGDQLGAADVRHAGRHELLQRDGGHAGGVTPAERDHASRRHYSAVVVDVVCCGGSE